MVDRTVDFDQCDICGHEGTIVLGVNDVWPPDIGFISADKRARAGDEGDRVQFREFRVIHAIHDYCDHVGIRPQLVGEIRTESGSSCKRSFVGQHADDVYGVLQVSFFDYVRPVERLTRFSLFTLLALWSLGTLYALVPLDALHTLGTLNALVAPWTQRSLIAFACKQDDRECKYHGH